jgi:MraZ protein
MAFEPFTSEANSRMDSKGRVSIPTAFRRVLDLGAIRSETSTRTRVVLVYGDPRRKFVAGYTQEGAAALAAQVKAMRIGSPERIAAERHLIIQSAPAEIDDDGRLVLPAPVRKKLGLVGDVADSEVYLAGVIDYFQLWKQSTYDAEAASLDQLDGNVLSEGEDILALLGRAGMGA